MGARKCSVASAQTRLQKIRERVARASGPRKSARRNPDVWAKRCGRKRSGAASILSSVRWSAISKTAPRPLESSLGIDLDYFRASSSAASRARASPGTIANNTHLVTRQPRRVRSQGTRSAAIPFLAPGTFHVGLLREERRFELDPLLIIQLTYVG